MVCTISPRLMVSEKEKELNAHLISAAPDLLKALEKMLASFHASVITDDVEMFAYAKQAIAKARGENL